MTTPHALVVDTRDASTQELLVDATGDDVLHLAGRGGDPDDDMQMPDWVELVARGVNVGMFGGARHAPWASRARVVENTFVRAERRNRWRIVVADVDPGVARVLAMVLRARDLDAAAVATVDAPPGVRQLQFAGLRFPGRYGECPFAVEQQEVVRQRRGRRIEIELAAPPGDAVRRRAADAVALWDTLLILGAYTRADLDPRRAGTLPDGAHWADEVTLVQTFDEAFDADPAAFDALINWAARLHHDGVAVRAVRVR